jgi:hypothetical protein
VCSLSTTSTLCRREDRGCTDTSRDTLTHIRSTQRHCVTTPSNNRRRSRHVFARNPSGSNPLSSTTKPQVRALVARYDVWAVRSRSDRRAHLFSMVMAGVGVPSRTPPADPVSAPAMRWAQALGRSAKSKTHPLSTSLGDTEIVVAQRESLEPDIALLGDRDRRLADHIEGGWTLTHLRNEVTTNSDRCHSADHPSRRPLWRRRYPRCIGLHRTLSPVLKTCNGKRPATIRKVHGVLFPIRAHR